MRRGATLLRVHGGVVLAVSRSVHTPLGIVSNDTSLTVSAHRGGQEGVRLGGVEEIYGRIMRLLGGLLSICQLGRTGRVQGSIPFSLRRLLRHATTNFSRVVGGGNVLFGYSFGSARIGLCNSTSHVRRVVSGLLAGTIGFARANAVGFGIRCLGKLLIVRVISANINVDRRALSHVFHPFRHRASTAGTSKFKLKLPVARKLIGLLSKAVRMADLVGYKDAFHIALPVPRASRPLRDRGRIPARSARLRRGMLIVSSSDVLRTIVGRVLRHGNVTYAAYAAIGRMMGTVQRGSCGLLLASVLVPCAGKFRLLALLHGSDVNGSGAVPVITVATHKRGRGSTFLGTKFATYVCGPFSSARLVNLLSAVRENYPSGGRSMSFDVVLYRIDSGVGLLYSFVSRSGGSIRRLGSTVRGYGEGGLHRAIRHVLPV